MYIHIEIMLAMAKIQSKNGLTKHEVVQEMCRAMHFMMYLKEPDIKVLAKQLKNLEDV